MLGSGERQQGHGKLRNWVFPGRYCEVEYSLRQSKVVPSADLPAVTQLGEIEYIRVLDGTQLPNGKYNLEFAPGQITETVGVRKRFDNWELLPV
jgi:hypothetical protein